MPEAAETKPLTTDLESRAAAAELMRMLVFLRALHEDPSLCEHTRNTVEMIATSVIIRAAALATGGKRIEPPANSDFEELVRVASGLERRPN